MGKIINISGQTFNYLTAIEYIAEIKKWKCLCRCGKITIVKASKLKNGETKSCGCWIKKDKINLTGKKFNMLNVIRKSGKLQNKQTEWICQCDCGNITFVTTNRLLTGWTKSCGCRKIKTSRETLLKILESRKKEKHWNWKGGISKERDKDMTTEKYKNWRISVFLRDKRKCQICLSDKDIQAHHIQSYKHFINLRYDINNGITMCKDCHKEFHKEYGMKFFGLFDYIEFYYKGYEIL